MNDSSLRPSAVAESCNEDRPAALLAVEAGAIFIVAHPFCWEEVSLPPDDPKANGMHTAMSWRPGTDNIPCAPDDFETVAHGVGYQILTVVSIYKPGHYPARVFYTRRWRDPRGREFGKGALRVKTMHAFKRLTKGYRVDFRVIDGDEFAELSKAEGRADELRDGVAGATNHPIPTA